jgi:hypothetical protein
MTAKAKATIAGLERRKQVIRDKIADALAGRSAEDRKETLIKAKILTQRGTLAAIYRAAAGGK